MMGMMVRLVRVMFHVSVMVMFPHGVMLLVHMYVKLLFLWNAPLYSEKLEAVHTLGINLWYTVYLENERKGDVSNADKIER
jgi:hypothetical protein